MSEVILSLLKKHPISTRLSDDELAELSLVFSHQSYKAGELVISEDASTMEMFFLVSGQVTVTKKIDGDVYHLGTMVDNDVFGELAYLTSQKRAGTIIARKSVEVLVFDESDLTRFPEQYHYLKYKLLLGLAVNRLQDNYHQVTSEVVLRNKFAKFVIAVILGFCVFVSFLQFQDDMLAHIGYYSIGVIGFSITAGLCVYVVKVLKQPLETFGVTWVGAQRSSYEAVAIIVLLIAAAHLVWPDIDFLGGIYPPSYLMLYLLVSFLQEFVFRGVLVTAFEMFYGSRAAGIFISAFLFGILHIHAGIGVAIYTFMAGVFLGALFLRHRCLVGVTLVHVCMGNVATLTGIMNQY